jgi:chitin disaccharide deacetylase
MDGKVAHWTAIKTSHPSIVINGTGKANMQTRVIINADDLGRSPGVNTGILRAHQEGAVTSTTALMNMPYSAKALREASAACPALGIGVHLNITQGRPVLPARQVRSLVGADGCFHLFHQQPDRLPRIRPDELRAEWQAQIESMLALGMQPDHLDSHHHSAYFHPSFFETMLDIASSYHLPIRYPPVENIDILGGHKAILHSIQQQRVAAPHSCQTGFYGGDVSLEQLQRILQELPDGTHELMCHPGVNDPDLDATSAYSRPREIELAILTDPALKAFLAENQIELARFSDL